MPSSTSSSRKRTVKTDSPSGSGSARRWRPPGNDGLPALKKAIGRATRTYGFLRYRDVRAYARGVDEVADLLDGLVTDGRPDGAIGLAEHALARLEKALDHADDSDGLIGDLLARFQRTHLEAYRAARPDPVKLAERLFRWELSDDWDVFRGAAETYSEVLGEAGLARYRLLAEAEWERMPTLAPVPDGREPHDPERFSITYMMESLAHAYQDVDMEIAVRGRDLSSAYRFLEIAQVCQDAGRSDEALDWAERGVRAFPERTDHRLREFIADEYLRRARGDDAMAVIWAQFLEQPALAAFQLLKRYADQIGTWALWRSRSVGPDTAGTCRRTARGWSTSSAGKVTSTRRGRKHKRSAVRRVSSSCWPRSARRHTRTMPSRSTVRRSSDCSR
jgi:hypothetical protein